MGRTFSESIPVVKIECDLTQMSDRSNNDHELPGVPRRPLRTSQH